MIAEKRHLFFHASSAPALHSLCACCTGQRDSSLASHPGHTPTCQNGPVDHGQSVRIQLI